MKSIRIAIITVALAGLQLTAIAGPNHDMTPYKGSKEFEQIKALEGRWEGTSTEKSKDKSMPEKFTLDYHTTSGGSAIIETMSAGTPHEMVTIYTDESGKLAVTHYCMMHNQPHMKLTGATGSKISLEAAATDPSVQNQSCTMRALTLDIVSPTELKQTWVSYIDGKKQPETVFIYKRI